jgi:hypothetical protein
VTVNRIGAAFQGGNPRRLFYQALQYGRGFRTGAAIYDYLFAPNSGRDFNVIVLAAGSTYGEMLAPPEQANDNAANAFNTAFGVNYDQHGLYQPQHRDLALPTVLWCPDYRLNYFGDCEGLYWNAGANLVIPPPDNAQQNAWPGAHYHPGDPPAAYPGEYVYRRGGDAKRVVRLTWYWMPSWLVLYHELGHVKQYYSAPAGTRYATWGNRLNNILNDIEAQNLRLHEKWLCRESGIPVRKHYNDDRDGHRDNFANRRQIYGGQWRPAWVDAYTPQQRAVEEARLAREARRNGINRNPDGVHFA